MKLWKRLIIHHLARRNIHVSRKHHANDFLIRKRIESEIVSQSKGVLHIGAHLGQEASFYHELGKAVTWIEASPFVFKELTRNIRHFPNQRSILALLGDENRESVPFNIADNNGASSSIFEKDKNSDVPFQQISQIQLPMIRLDALISLEEIKMLDHWVVDVQGAERQVLLGSGTLIEYCNSIIVEVKKISYYREGSKWIEILSFLKSHGFINLWEVEDEAEDNVFFIRVRDRKTI